MKVFAVHDLKAKAFMSFHVLKSDAEASRQFAEAVLEPKSLLGKYAEDFELCRLGDVVEDYVDMEWLKANSELLTPDFAVIVTAQQVLDLQPKAGATVDAAQVQLMREG